ncbi:hypothetical protein AHF37_03625 [Paragonimus kellicotti]|nr:hypothetical protein AHF37_03625 [Paragonimus kellicotti]
MGCALLLNFEIYESRPTPVSDGGLRQLANAFIYITGMPPEWTQLLGMAGITKYEQQQNPRILLSVLNILSKNDFTREKYMTAPCDQTGKLQVAYLTTRH